MNRAWKSGQKPWLSRYGSTPGNGLGMTNPPFCPILRQFALIPTWIRGTAGVSLGARGHARGQRLPARGLSGQQIQPQAEEAVQRTLAAELVAHLLVVAQFAV